MLKQAKLKHKYENRANSKDHHRPAVFTPPNHQQTKYESEIEKRRIKAKSNANLQQIAIPPMRQFDTEVALASNTPLIIK